jgi:hypothetical protein
MRHFLTESHVFAFLAQQTSATHHILTRSAPIREPEAEL